MGLPSDYAPAPAPVLRGHGRAFRASLGLFLQPAAWWTPVLGGAVGAALTGLSALIGRVAVWPAALAAVAVGIWFISVLGMATTLLLYIAFCPARVGVDGIAGYSFWGLPLLRWQEVGSAGTRRLLGSPFLVVTSARRRRRALWVALPLADPAGFAAAVAEHGGPDNPVAAALAGPGAVNLP